MSTLFFPLDKILLLFELDILLHNSENISLPPHILYTLHKIHHIHTHTFVDQGIFTKYSTLLTSIAKKHYYGHPGYSFSFSHFLPVTFFLKHSLDLVWAQLIGVLITTSFTQMMENPNDPSINV